LIAFFIIGINLIGLIVGIILGHTAKGNKGMIVGGGIGLVLAYFAQAAIQDAEVGASVYADVAATTDCRLKPLIDKALADEVLTKREYTKLRDVKSDLDLADAKAAAIGRRGDDNEGCAARKTRNI
jgi:hypothetical protein